MFRQQAGLVDYSSVQPWPRQSRSTKHIHRRSVTRHRYRQSWLINVQTATDREKNDSSADRQRRSIYRFLAVNKSQTTSNNRSICISSAHQWRFYRGGMGWLQPPQKSLVPPLKPPQMKIWIFCCREYHRMNRSCRRQPFIVDHH